MSPIEREIAAAERKAWDALARYKFWMFGYHAAQWVLLTRVSGLARPNPFKPLVKMARLSSPVTHHSSQAKP